MQVKIADSWQEKLQSEFDKDYFKSLTDFVKEEYQNHTCYPKQEDIFSAFNYCSFEDVKVVIIGQDPYHGEGQANGLCFSVYDDIKHPPSLKNIFKLLQEDLKLDYPESGDLSRWATQGVLLLNSILTVRKGKAGSHKRKGWELFTDAVIQIISEQKNDIVFLLWGNYAKKKGKNIDRDKHFVSESGHPSPLSANKGLFKVHHFSKTNDFLHQKGMQPIEW